MPFYMEASLRWSADESLTAVSRAHFERHQAQHPFSTILLPLREESVTWQSSEWLVPGQVIYSPENQYVCFPTLHPQIMQIMRKREREKQ